MRSIWDRQVLCHDLDRCSVLCKAQLPGLSGAFCQKYWAFKGECVTRDYSEEPTDHQGIGLYRSFAITFTLLEPVVLTKSKCTKLKEFFFFFLQSANKYLIDIVVSLQLLMYKNIHLSSVKLAKLSFEPVMTEVSELCSKWWYGFVPLILGFPGDSDGKESAGNVEALGSIPGPGRSTGEGTGNPLQYSCLENPMDTGAWWAIVHGVVKNQTWLSK